MTKKEDKALLTLWSELVKLIANYKCEWCGIANYLNSHHVFSKSNPLTKHDPDNGVCLCAGHHTLKTLSAHKAPAEFLEYMRTKRGEKWYQSLRVRANYHSLQKTDFKLTKIYLENEIKKYKN